MNEMHIRAQALVCVGHYKIVSEITMSIYIAIYRDEPQRKGDAFKNIVIV